MAAPSNQTSIATTSTPEADMNLSMEGPRSSPAEDDHLMAAIEHFHNCDVLCGRGVTTNRHPGNERFRALVSANKELYVSSTKREKMAISRSIVEAVRARSPPGRFLEKDADTGLWYDIGDKKAIEKTSQALRDGAASLRKQLSDDMSDPNFLEAVFDGVDPCKDDVVKCEAKVSKPGKKAGPGHRRTNSSPAITGRSSGSVKRKNPPCDKHSVEILASDEKSQKDALKRMAESAAGAAATPFRPDRRPTSHRHKRTASAGSIPVGRLFSRQSHPGCPYPRQTPPSSPNPYIRPSPPMSPYYGAGGYHRPGPMSPFPYTYSPTSPSPQYGRSCSWGSDHPPPPPPPPPPPRQNSDPSPMNSPRGMGSYQNGPPSPVAYATRRSPPAYPYSPRKSHSAYPYHHGPASPRPQQLTLSPSAVPRSPYQQQQHHHHHHRQQRFDDQNNQYQHHKPYPSSPSRPGYPPRSPRTSDMCVEDDRPGPPMLSIPTLGQNRHDDKSGLEESSGRDKDYMPPPPTWYPNPQMSPQRSQRSQISPEYQRDTAHMHDKSSSQVEEPPPPVLSEAASELRPPIPAAPQQYSSPRSKLLPSRLRDGSNPFWSEFQSPSETRPDDDSFKVEVESDQDDSKQDRSVRFDAHYAAPNVEASMNKTFDIAKEAPSAPPPEQICRSFTFVDGQLMENDAPTTASRQSEKVMTMNPKQALLTGPSDSPNTPKAVDAVDRFDVENDDTLKKVDFGSTGFRPRPKLEAETGDNDNYDKQDNPALPDFPLSKVNDDMLMIDDGSLSPLPFDGADTREEPLIDLGEHMHLFDAPYSSPTSDVDA